MKKVIVAFVSLAGIYLLTGCSKQTMSGAASNSLHYFVRSGDIVSPVTVSTNEANRVEVRFALSDAKADGLRNFIAEHKAEPNVDVSIGHMIITKLGMDSGISISNSKVCVSYPASEASEAEALADSIRRE